MFELFRTFFGDPPDEAPGKDVIGKLVVFEDRTFQAILRVPRFPGAFAAIEVGADGTAKFGSPLVLIQHAPTALLDLDLVEGKARSDILFSLSLMTGAVRVLRSGPCYEKPWTTVTAEEDHPEDCPSNRPTVGYDGNRKGTAAAEKPFLDQFCFVHRHLLDAWLLEQGFVKGVWPLQRIEVAGG